MQYIVTALAVSQLSIWWVEHTLSAYELVLAVVATTTAELQYVLFL
jgi:hypothetical protein